MTAVLDQVEAQIALLAANLNENLNDGVFRLLWVLVGLVLLTFLNFVNSSVVLVLNLRNRSLRTTQPLERRLN